MTKGRNELISLMLGILYALGPAGERKQKMLVDAWKELRYNPFLSQETRCDIKTLSQVAVASVCSYDESSNFREGWEYLSSEAKARRSSEEWLKKAKEERKIIPRAVFSPIGTGEVCLGVEGDLAVIEVFGISSEFTYDGEVRETRGTVLAGFICVSERWLVQSISWYPEDDKNEILSTE